MGLRDNYGWLIEHGGSPTNAPRYWAAGQIDPSRSSAWTENHEQAIRFARQIDAERVAQRFMRKVPLEVRICEHGWES